MGSPSTFYAGAVVEVEDPYLCCYDRGGAATRIEAARLVMQDDIDACEGPQRPKLVAVIEVQPGEPAQLSFHRVGVTAGNAITVEPAPQAVLLLEALVNRTGAGYGS